jgi:hypothetical protein
MSSEKEKAALPDAGVKTPQGWKFAAWQSCPQPA